jgi:hypothetical protein
MLCSDFPLSNEQPLCLTREEWLQPKSVFKALFEEYDCSHLKKLLHRWLNVIMLRKALPQKKILRMDDAQEHLLRLLEAGCLLEGKDICFLPVDADWMDTIWWLGPVHADAIPFDYFPRSLNLKEYCSPYQVFYTCRAKYTLPGWRLLLRDCFTAGACTDVLYELHSVEGALDAYRLLPKVLEAAYLIYVREFWRPTHMAASE